MIQRRDGRAAGVRVTFELPEEVAREGVSVVGDFNDWDPDAHPMRRLKKGRWKKDIHLEPGRSYAFRYFVDGHTWLNDEGADRYEPSGLASENSVIDL